MLFYWPRNLDPIGPLDMSLVHHKDESIYVLHLAALVEHAGTARGLMGVKDSCVDWS